MEGSVGEARGEGLGGQARESDLVLHGTGTGCYERCLSQGVAFQSDSLNVFIVGMYRDRVGEMWNTGVNGKRRPQAKERGSSLDSGQRLVRESGGSVWPGL